MPYLLLRSGAIVSDTGSILYEAREMRDYSQAQRAKLVDLHNEYPELKESEALEILKVWEREGVE